MHNYTYFISYKREPDQELANQVGDLFIRNYRQHVFVDTHNLSYGGRWIEELKVNIENSEYVVALFTEDYIRQVESSADASQNIILQELIWAVEANKLIPVAVGIPPGEVVKRCRINFPPIAEINCLPVVHDELCHERIVLELEKQHSSQSRIRIESRLQVESSNTLAPDNPQTKASVTTETTPQLSAQQAYDKFNFPWAKPEALAIKADIEEKSIGQRSSLESTVLAKFYVTGRFDIPIDANKALMFLVHAQNTLPACPEAFFELGKIYEFGASKSSFNDEKAFTNYKKADSVGYYPATFNLARLIEERNNGDQIKELEQLLSGIEHSYPLPDLINEDAESYYQRAIDLAEADIATNQARALFYQAKCYWSLDQHMVEVEAKLEFASDLGYLPAKEHLAWGIIYNDHFQTDYQKAASLLNLAEDDGSIDSRLDLAKLHIKEPSDEAFIPNPDYALELLKKNIELNHWGSLEFLVDGVKPKNKQHLDKDFIIDHLKRAHSQADHGCSVSLAYYYESKDKNIELAISTYQQCIKQAGTRADARSYAAWRVAELMLAADNISEGDLKQIHQYAFFALLHGEERAKETLGIVSALQGSMSLAQHWFNLAKTSVKSISDYCKRWGKKSPWATVFLMILVDKGSVRATHWITTAYLGSGIVPNIENIAPNWNDLKYRLKQAITWEEKLKGEIYSSELGDDLKKDIKNLEVYRQRANAMLAILDFMSNSGNKNQVDKANQLLCNYKAFKHLPMTQGYLSTPLEQQLLEFIVPTNWRDEWKSFYYVPSLENLKAIKPRISAIKNNEELWPERAPTLLFQLASYKHKELDAAMPYEELKTLFKKLLHSIKEPKDADLNTLSIYKQTQCITYLSLLKTWKAKFLVETLEISKPSEFETFVNNNIKLLQDPPEAWHLLKSYYPNNKDKLIEFLKNEMQTYLQQNKG